MPNVEFRRELQQTRRVVTAIRVSLASPDSIIDRSHGEVTKPETINYRSYRPEKDGLFCEKIFGPVRDWECHCGKYKKIRYKGIVCDRCGVEVTQKSVRRERMGHITLATPVVHIWYLRSLPSKIGNLLGMSTKELEKIVYYEAYVVVQAGAATELKEKQLLTEEEYYELQEKFPHNNELDDSDGRKIIVKIGGEAVKEMLKRVDVDSLSDTLRVSARTEKSEQKRIDVLKRLKVAEAFRNREGDEFINKPEWMVLEVIPVIPPELRPLVPLEGGRFATSDLNDLYRRVIIRNNRLKRLIDIKAPEVILRNEKRMLQEAVDALLDNSRRISAVNSDSQRALKSLSDVLKGKQGRFRQNLLGKRVDYSGRSVIVVGPELKLHQCGLPKDMAVELFKPMIIRKLLERGEAKTAKTARRLVDRKVKEVWEVLPSIVDGHPVMLNRAPTLHRLGIQAFQPVLVDSKAIKLHPLVCTAFNADFDGDQMAVHVPLSYEAQLEARILMLSSHNLLSPAHGKPIVHPTQDMVLGLYYLTKIRKAAQESPRHYSSVDEIRMAIEMKKMGYHDPIKFKVNGEFIDTTPGRALFNEIVPVELGFINEVLTKSKIISIIAESYKKAGPLKTATFLDDLKELGFESATAAGLSINVNDVIIPEVKRKFIDISDREVKEIEASYEGGFITAGERYNKIIDVWQRATNLVSDAAYKTLSASKDGFNSIWMMLDSGARGSKDQVKQLAAMRGLMAKPQKSLTGQVGDLIENPIIANFREGLSILEYFISTHGARKGLADTALKTADAGYLTRRLVDVSQDVVIASDDCGTIRGISVSAIKDGERVQETLVERILGRAALYDVVDPLSNEVIVKANGEITEDLAEKIANTAIDSVDIRSVLTCEAPHGVCAKCYGRNLATGKMVEIGDAVGIIAAQSIGEPGTQLTLRTFHTGGTASVESQESNVIAPIEGRLKFENMHPLVDYTNRTTGKPEKVLLGRHGVIQILDKDNRAIKKMDVPQGAHLVLDEGDTVNKGDLVYQWDPYNTLILTEFGGKIRWSDLKKDTTYREQTDEQTGQVEKVVIESVDKNMTPSLEVVHGTKLRRTYNLPVGAHIVVEDGEEVQSGETLAKKPKELSRVRDVTTGLPRVQELFEARAPQDPATVSEIDGYVGFGGQSRGNKEVIVTSADGKDRKTYKVSLRQHILVQENDFVIAGERLTDGSVDPHDILRIKGPADVQKYLLDEIQEVYRQQNVNINDKHIEVIVRQMFQRVKVVDSGDTPFLEGDIVDVHRMRDENASISKKVVVTAKGDSKYRVGQIVERALVMAKNRDMRRAKRKVIEFRDAVPATSEDVLLGITSAALSTDSFISAASFQETTKVLTDASVEGRLDKLAGLKENVIIGQLIPAGTGLKKFRDLILTEEEMLEKAEEEAEAEVPSQKVAS
ncbi:MAG: DNA-directed RNA polymerase subunit beta' [Bacteroidetes bacterium]|nr:DNA-directed RNA polymerase subunit beta' [Bacteroidota bacterium]